MPPKTNIDADKQVLPDTNDRAERLMLLTNAYCSALRALVNTWTLESIYFADYEDTTGTIFSTGCKTCSRRDECFAPVIFDAGALIDANVLGTKNHLLYSPCKTTSCLHEAIEYLFNGELKVSVKEEPVWCLSFPRDDGDVPSVEFFKYSIKARDKNGEVKDYPVGVDTLPDSSCSPINVKLPLIDTRWVDDIKRERQLVFDWILSQVAAALVKGWQEFNGSSFSGLNNIFTGEDLRPRLKAECHHPAHASERYTIMNDIDAFEKAQLAIPAPPGDGSQCVVEGVAGEGAPLSAQACEGDDEDSSESGSVPSGSVRKERERRFDKFLAHLVGREGACYVELAVWLGLSDKKESERLGKWLRRSFIESEACKEGTHYFKRESQTSRIFFDESGRECRSKALYLFTAEGFDTIKKRYVDCADEFTSDNPS